jgi:hypothetical protein
MPRLLNRVRNDERPCNHYQLHNHTSNPRSQSTNHSSQIYQSTIQGKARGRSRHKEQCTKQPRQTSTNTTDTKIHKQAQGKPLFPIADVRSGAALAMLEADPAGINEEAADAVLEASVAIKGE